jgi:hypothetical protein
VDVCVTIVSTTITAFAQLLGKEIFSTSLVKVELERAVPSAKDVAVKAAFAMSPWIFDIALASLADSERRIGLGMCHWRASTSLMTTVVSLNLMEKALLMRE